MLIKGITGDDCSVSLIIAWDRRRAKAFAGERQHRKRKEEVSL